MSPLAVTRSLGRDDPACRRPGPGGPRDVDPDGSRGRAAPGGNGLSRVRSRFTIAAMVRECEAIYDAVLRGPALPETTRGSAVADRVFG